ncbi:MAG TPA: ribosomal protein S18-alanine N-acetyltransferase [Methylomirabilota bacterium]|nr:ribosomal protein S18-alanine N-acetyltransferase [Methylomirabilota bacterium]
MLPFHIDLMHPDDLDDVIVTERLSFKTPWSRSAFLYELKDNEVASCWVARPDDPSLPRVIGYLCVWEIGPELHITNLAVHPAYRQQGVARRLLAERLEGSHLRGAKVAILEVRPANREAIALYERFGFRVIGNRKGYYFDTGEDALVMEADLMNWPAGNKQSGFGVKKA